MPGPSIYGYENYRVYLKDYYEWRKADSGEFSYRVFAREAGFKSPNFLKLVIDGQRNLTTESLRQVCRALKLHPEENEFFRRLVAFNQATEPLERRRLAGELYQSAVFRSLYPLKQAQLDYYQNWYYVPIREMVGTADFQESGAWISAKLNGKIPPAVALKALADLEALALLKRDESGRLRPADANVTTGSEVISSAVAEFHRQMLKLAGDSIAEVPRHLREISSSTLVLSESDFARFKTLVQEFRRSLLAQASPGSGSRVYHVAFQLFPLTRALDEAPTDQGEDACKKGA